MHDFSTGKPRIRTSGRRRWGRAAAAAIGLALAGCHRDDFGATLPYTLPSRYVPNQSLAAPKVSNWWKRFGSAELDSLIDDANADNFDIAAAVARLKQAEATVLISRAALFPTLTFNDSNSRTQSSGTGAEGVIQKQSQTNSFGRLFSASYILDVWGQNRALLEAAVHNKDASAYQVEVTRLTALVAVVNAYLTYAASEERVTVAEENLRNAERILKVINERVAAGTASELDVSQQKNLVANQKAAIPPLRQTAETSRTALALLVGHPLPEVRLKIRSTRRLTLPKTAPGIPSSLLVRRPDVKATEEQMWADDADVAAARAALLPTIQLTGDAGLESAALRTLFLPQSFVWSIAANATQTIFDGGKLRAQVKLTEAQRQELLENYRKAILSAFTDVQNALIAIREGAAREAAEKEAVAEAQIAFRLSEQRLREGTIDLTTLVTVQNTLFQAQDSLIQYRLARLQAAVSLFQALGGDWDAR